MRKALKRPLFRDIIVWTAVLSLSLFYTVPELIRRMYTPEGVITVDKINISNEEFQAEVNSQQRKINALFRQYGNNAKLILEYSGLSSNPVEMAYNVLVRQALINSVAAKYNLKIDQDLLNNEVIRLLPDGAVSSNGKLNIPLEFIEDLKRTLKNELIGKMVLDFVQASAYVSEFELKSNFIERFSKKDYEILTFSFAEYLKAVKDKKATDQDLLAFYNANKAKYYVEEKRAGKVWNFDAEKYGIQIKDEDLKNYYNKNKSQFKDKAAELKVARIFIKHSEDAAQKAKELHDQLIKDPSKFAALAKEYSDDKESASKGGVIDSFKRGDKDPDFEQAAFALSKDNPISSVVRTKDGYEIINFIDKVAATFKELNAVEDQIKTILQKERFKKLFPVNARKAMSSSNKDVELAKFKEKGQAGITYDKMPKSESKDIKKLFALKDINEVDYFIDGDKGFLVQLTKIEPAHTPAFKDIKEKVEADYFNEKALLNLKSDIEKAKKDSETLSFGEISKKYKASERIIKDLSSDDKAVLGKLSAQNIPAYKMINLQLEGVVLADVSDKGGSLIKLVKIGSFDEKAFEDKKAELLKELQRLNKQILAEGFIASLKKDAKISINDERLKNQLKDLL